jgi:hypothetical protein
MLVLLTTHIMGFRRLGQVDRHDIVVCIGVHEVLIDEGAWRDDTGHLAGVHQTARLDLFRGVVGELLGNGYMAVEVLDEELEKAV